jgi:hypothetical protein
MKKINNINHQHLRLYEYVEDNIHLLNKYKPEWLGPFLLSLKSVIHNYDLSEKQYGMLVQFQEEINAIKKLMGKMNKLRN